MPFVIKTNHSAKFGDSYYAGPISIAQGANISPMHRRDVPTVSDIDTATRIPVIFGLLAERKAKELKAQVVYDEPKPVKLLKKAAQYLKPRN